MGRIGEYVKSLEKSAGIGKKIEGNLRAYIRLSDGELRARSSNERCPETNLGEGCVDPVYELLFNLFDFPLQYVQGQESRHERYNEFDTEVKLEAGGLMQMIEMRAMDKETYDHLAESSELDLINEWCEKFSRESAQV